MKKYIPNILSTIRLIMAPFIPLVFLCAGPLAKPIFYLVGIGTDLVDGFLARHWHVQSKYGKFIDPIADKSFNLIAFISTIIIFSPALIPILLIESFIAASTAQRALNIIKLNHNEQHNIEYFRKSKKDFDKDSKVTFIDKIKASVSKAKLVFNMIDEMHVSIIGKIKSFGIAGSVLSVLAAPISPFFSIISSALIISTIALDLPVAFRYYLEKKISERTLKLDHEIYHSFDTYDQVQKLEKDKKTLEKFDKFDRGICVLFKKLCKKSNDTDNIKDDSTLIVQEESTLKEEVNTVVEDLKINNKDQQLTNVDYYNYYEPNNYDNNDLGIARTKNIHHK